MSKSCSSGSLLQYSGQGDNFMNEQFRALLETPPLNRPPANGTVDAAMMVRRVIVSK